MGPTLGDRRSNSRQVTLNTTSLRVSHIGNWLGHSTMGKEGYRPTGDITQLLSMARA